MTEDKIQAYILGVLPEEERPAIQQLIDSDPKWQNIFKQYQELDQWLAAERAAQLKEKVLSFENSLRANDRSNRSIGNRWWLWLLVFAGIIFAVFQITTHTDTAIAKRYFKDPRNLNVAGEVDALALFTEANQHYFAEKDYAAAIVDFEALANSELADQAQFYLAHAYFRNKDYSLASEQFGLLKERLNNYNDPYDQQLIQWNGDISRLAAEGQTPQLIPEDWPEDFPAEDLQQDLTSMWHF